MLVINGFLGAYDMLSVYGYGGSQQAYTKTCGRRRMQFTATESNMRKLLFSEHTVAAERRLTGVNQTIFESV